MNHLKDYLVPFLTPATHPSNLQLTHFDGAENYPLVPGFDPRAVQPVASRYTDRAIPAHCNKT